MWGAAVNKWQREFRAAAAAGGIESIREHLARLHLPCEPALLVEGTIAVVNAVLAYRMLDNPNAVDEVQPFLRMQRCEPGGGPGGLLACTLDLNGRAAARIMVEDLTRDIDLADLYGHPWDDYRVVGFSRLWIARADYGELSWKELRALEAAVERDFGFDDEEDVSLGFEDDPDSRFLLCHVQDVFESGKTGGDGD